MIFLWSDYCVYILILMGLTYGILVAKNPLQSPIWRKIMLQPLTIASLLILMVYISVGVLDSIHYKKDNTVVSVLDEILAPLSVHSEISYSEPFALYGYTKESISLPNGKVTRNYARLKHGGAHITQPSQHYKDIKLHLIHILVQSMIVWGAVAILSLMLIAYWLGLPLEQLIGIFPLKSYLFTLFIIIFCILAISEFKNLYHIFGTDQIGDDVLYAALKSVRTGLIIGTVTTMVMLPFALLFGLMAGYFKGWIDDAIQYIYTTLSSVPGVLLISAAVLALQMIMERHGDWFQTTIQRADARLLALCMILGITSWTSLCRLLRGEALKISQIDFVQAALALGSSHFRILRKHLLPNVFHIVLISLALDFSGLVLAEAVLSYVGVGVDPSSFSWGTMINSARLEMAREPVVWWNLSAAFVFMFILVLAANIFADALRDAFDPRTYQGKA